MQTRRVAVLVMVLCLGAWMATSAALALEFLDPSPLEQATREQVIVAGTTHFINRQNEEKFPLAEKLSPEGWFSVDLKPYCNVNLFSDAGVTTPVAFPFMPLGRPVFYGVPFQVIAPAENANKTTIALPSTRLLPNSIPASVEVPVGRKAAVLYFLHATYYTSPAGNQSYRMNYEDGTNSTLKFIGTVHSGDWYHPDTRVYSEDVHYVLIPAAKDSKTFHRNMHIVQWKNPFPEKAIRSITFTSDPKAEMAILVVAVTGH
jgi:hypothetical protein